jgi:type II restriction enzyme
MDLSLNFQPLEEGHSNSQVARTATEAWVEANAYCPNCNSARLTRLRANTPFRDFECPSCTEPFELKSKRNGIPASILGGSAAAYQRAFDEGRVPSFLVLAYSRESRQVTDLIGFNRALLSPLALMKRVKPLARPGSQPYYMCSLNTQSVPECGKIPIVRNGFSRPQKFVRESWDRFRFLRLRSTSEDSAWSRDILACIAQLPGREFTVGELFAFASGLQEQHPNNHHIREKIRQQLQILCAQRVIRRISPGVYESIY